MKITLKEFKGVFREFYRGLVLLEGYCNLNVEALQKIIKKHQKNIGTVNKNYYFKNNVQPLEFYKHSLLKILVHESEVKLKFLEISEKFHSWSLPKPLRMDIVHKPWIN